MADENEKTESEKDTQAETEKDDAKTQADAPEPKTLEEALALLKKVGGSLTEANAEAAKRRKALKKYEDEETKRKQADEEKRKSELTEAEKLKQEKAELAQRLEKQEADFKAERIKNAVELAATRLNFHDPADAVKLADLAEVDIEDGKVVGVDEALKKLAKAKPHLIKAEQTTDTQIDATRRSKGDKPAMTDEEKREFAARYNVRPEHVK